MHAISKDKTRIHYQARRRKDAPFCIVFIHGWGNNWTAWKQSYLHFSKQYSVISVDLRGHGQSGKPILKDSYKMKHFVEDIEAVLRKEKVTRFILAGHSLGGMITMEFASKSRLKPLAIVLAATSARNVMKIRSMDKYQHKMLDIVDRSLDSKRLRNEPQVKKTIDLSKLKKQHDAVILFNGLKNCSLTAIAACMKTAGEFDGETMYQNLRLPMLVVHGTEDLLFPKDVAESMVRLNSHARLALVKGGYHDINIQLPELVDAAIEDFIYALKI